MTAKTKGKKKRPKSGQAARNKTTPMKRTAKKKARVRAGSKKLKSKRRKPIRRRSRAADTAAFSRKGPGARSGEQSGDLQGLSSVEAADSESVEELLEEGNAFEADVVAGVENAANTNPREVRTHEVPEDDVPDEYLDKE